MDTSIQLASNGVEYAHGFAVLSLSPSQATVNYYQVPVSVGEPPAEWMFGESFPAPGGG
ncbi:MAG TPA: hypothetical protein VGB24_00780 [Longimicrobium sp.]|jgi:hypothetical protein|uniref:hypothetical protein n=1 Tax=Longimicrobium sp. TaxID=2029185 RepID=UPI002ED788A2